MRKSALKAIDSLDKNKFPNRTDFVERLVENYLIKKNCLAPNPDAVVVSQEASKAA